MIKYFILAALFIIVGVLGDMQGRTEMKEKILHKPEEFELMKKPDEKEPIYIPLAADARLLTQLAIDSEYENSPYKRDLVNQMKAQINAAINMGKTYTTFDADLKTKIRINFSRAEIDTIFAGLGYVIRYNQFGEFEWISWDINALPETEDQTRANALVRKIREASDYSDYAE